MPDDDLPDLSAFRTGSTLRFHVEYDIAADSLILWFGGYPIRFATGDALLKWLRRVASGDRSVMPRPPGKVVDTPFGRELKAAPYGRDKGGKPLLTREEAERSLEPKRYDARGKVKLSFAELSQQIAKELKNAK